MSIWGFLPGVKLTTDLHIVLRVRFCAALTLRSSICLRGTDWNIFAYLPCVNIQAGSKYLRAHSFRALMVQTAAPYYGHALQHRARSVQ